MGIIETIFRGNQRRKQVPDYVPKYLEQYERLYGNVDYNEPAVDNPRRSERKCQETTQEVIETPITRSTDVDIPLLFPFTFYLLISYMFGFILILYQITRLPLHDYQKKDVYSITEVIRVSRRQWLQYVTICSIVIGMYRVANSIFELFLARLNYKMLKSTEYRNRMRYYSSFCKERHELHKLSMKFMATYPTNKYIEKVNDVVGSDKVRLLRSRY
ncbi:unnamed protein product [Caenorhabditis bovis]|uniref:Uncharacterized protein n=1 Tax=Caenorhabditis bovis TaxID=2654633 RepID=A0A8S1FFA0_9PELO|nr:unnamed protein product [Caenorhabditis bovis]